MGYFTQKIRVPFKIHQTQDNLFNIYSCYHALLNIDHYYYMYLYIFTPRTFNNLIKILICTVHVVGVLFYIYILYEQTISKYT